MKSKNNIKKNLVIFMCLVMITFGMNFFSFNSIYADSSHGGGGASFGGSSSSSENGSSSTGENKTGLNINDVTGLGNKTLDETSGVIGELSILGGSGTEGGTTDHEMRYGNFNNALYQVWGVILVVLQVASIAGIIFAGVRYMFASADAKADLKKSMIHLVIGMIIVFGASTVVGFITGTFKDIFSPLL